MIYTHTVKPQLCALKRSWIHSCLYGLWPILHWVDYDFFTLSYYNYFSYWVDCVLFTCLYMIHALLNRLCIMHCLFSLYIWYHFYWAHCESFIPIYNAFYLWIVRPLYIYVYFYIEWKRIICKSIKEINMNIVNLPKRN